VGELTLTQMPLRQLGLAVSVSVCEPNAPVLSQARTRTVWVPALMVTEALIELVGPDVFQAATLST
jgi:hypothetical protein